MTIAAFTLRAFSSLVQVTGGQHTVRQFAVQSTDTRVVTREMAECATSGPFWVRLTAAQIFLTMQPGSCSCLAGFWFLHDSRQDEAAGV